MMKCVTRLRGLTAWPGMEATEHFRKGKTYREQAVKELHLLRLLVESGIGKLTDVIGYSGHEYL